MFAPFSAKIAIFAEFDTRSRSLHAYGGFSGELAFSAWQTTGDQLPESNYPMALHQGEAYAILYHLPDGGTMWWYGVTTDQTDWNAGVVTVQVTPPEAA